MTADRPHDAESAAGALDIYGPIAQARRCLDRWLAEENRRLPERQRRQAAALMARYFHHEDCVTDALMMSFLRHYAGFRAIDMDDPASVRHALRTVLDQSVAEEPLPPVLFSSRFYVLAAAVFALLLAAAVLGLRPGAVTPVSAAQQDALKARVERIVRLDGKLSHAAVWAQVKRPFAVRSYRHIPARDFARARDFLDSWIARLEQPAAGVKLVSGARM